MCAGTMISLATLDLSRARFAVLPQAQMNERPNFAGNRWW
jgi:hypothetical protein